MKHLNLPVAIFSLVFTNLFIFDIREIRAQETHGISRPSIEQLNLSDSIKENKLEPKRNIPVKSKSQNLNRPKIGLVLKGGGALGFAHVGVLKVLERNHIPIDVIAGTSMGSIVGAAYASGASLAEMEKVLSETSWGEFFGEKIHRQNVDYRLKAGRSREIYGDTKFSFEGGKFHTPMGVVEGQNIRPLFQELFGNPATPINYDSLPIPFRAVTTDLETGEVYVPDSGDLATVVRASMSIPGAFSPVQIDGRILVDGGLADNLPIDVALKMGSDILIVVDLKSDLAKANTLTSPLDISGQMVSMLLMQNSAHSLKLLRTQDLVISPNVNGFAVTDFPRGQEIMKIGEQSAEAMTEALAHLAIPPESYAQYQSKRGDRNHAPTRIDFVRIKNNSNVSDGRIKEIIKIKVGDTFDPEKINQDVQNIYQTGYFKTVQYSIVKEGEKTGVEIDANKKDWLGQFIRLGFSLEDNLNGDDGFRLGASFRTDDIGSKDSYLEAQAEIGRTPRFSLELYQPVVEHSPYFFSPKLAIEQNTININQENTTLAEYLRTDKLATIGFGRRISTIGEARLDYTRGIGKLSPSVGGPDLSYSHYDIGDLAAVLELDDLDKPDFPTTGFRSYLRYGAAIDSLGSPTDFQDLSGQAMLPITSGRHTLIIRNNFETTFGERPLERSSGVGGFLNISGTLQSSIAASDYESGQAILYRRFSEVENPFFDIAFFAGGSFEITSIHNTIPSLDSYNLINSGSIFVGADTPLLPIYLGYGIADIGDISMGRIGKSGK